MKQSIKKYFKKLIVLLLIGFLLLFIFRILYESNKKAELFITPIAFEIPESNLEIRKNYASKMYEINYEHTSTKLDQKYEKIATINTFSSSFEIEEELVRKQIKNFNGLIQFENKKGNNGYRNLNMVIGVPPENFDNVYSTLTKIGIVTSKEITKTDKTNEYKELNAKKLSLEKIKNSLIELKSKGGKIEEFMQLENRILDIEQQLQALGVSLGNFDNENEFCTVNFSLKERAEIKIGSLQIVINSLEWTISTYLKIMATLTFLSLFAFLIITIVEKLKKS